MSDDKSSSSQNFFAQSTIILCERNVCQLESIKRVEYFIWEENQGTFQVHA
jgi:hypothetical protein